MTYCLAHYCPARASCLKAAIVPGREANFVEYAWRLDRAKDQGFDTGRATFRCDGWEQPKIHLRDMVT